MSAAQVTFDDYAFPSPRSPQSYEINLGHGVAHPASLYPHGHLDASMAGPHLDRQISHIPVESTAHPLLAEQPDFVMQYHLPGAPGPFMDVHHPYPMDGRPPSPRGLYAATSGWNGTNPYVGYYNPSHAFLQNLQSVIESTHTVQTQQQNAANMAASAHQGSGPSQSNWSLSGSLDPNTGVFQRSVEHPRLRTAQACEKCRARKAKCSGEKPCGRCKSRGLPCEYASERKMRGPNKNKRKTAVPPQTRVATPPTASERVIPDSASTPASSDSESATTSDHRRSESTPGTFASYTVEIPSAQSSPAPAHSASPPATDARRPRAATVGQNPSGPSRNVPACFEAVHTGFAKPRPPPLDLSEEREMYPRLLAEYARNAGQGPFPAPIPVENSNKRTSLPAYLLQSYSRVALHNSNEGSAAIGVPVPVPLDTQAIPHDVSGFLNPSPIDTMAASFPPPSAQALSNSPVVSTPITPLSLAYDSLMYPDGTSALDNGYGAFGLSPTSSDGGHMGAFGGMEDILQAKDFEQDGWDVAAVAAAAAAAAAESQLAEDDETPRATPNDDVLIAELELMGPVEAAP